MGLWYFIWGRIVVGEVGEYKSYHKAPFRVEREVLRTSNLSDHDMNTVYTSRNTKEQIVAFSD